MCRRKADHGSKLGRRYVDRFHAVVCWVVILLYLRFEKMDVISSAMRWYPPIRVRLVITCKTTSVKTLRFYIEAWS